MYDAEENTFHFISEDHVVLGVVVMLRYYVDLMSHSVLDDDGEDNVRKAVDTLAVWEVILQLNNIDCT
jgi:hypothetical protein